eukprot:TRINITY_DN3779_c0_g1_i1.p1 TRINITY_DN3779_c0_g1~~TRINITY_DN3779_c0_g1_i1.p1  ORF type:complete len:121 (+),score=38.75 TRINITY_DN3779_c0_g1_i1:585-947(+)
MQISILTQLIHALEHTAQHAPVNSTTAMTTVPEHPGDQLALQEALALSLAEPRPDAGLAPAAQAASKYVNQVDRELAKAPNPERAKWLEEQKAAKLAEAEERAVVRARIAAQRQERNGQN